MSTLTVYPDAHPETNTVDGVVWAEYPTSSDKSWEYIRNAAGNVSDDDDSTFWYFLYMSSDVTGYDNKWRALVRVIFLFDTSSLGAGATISAAVLSVYGGSHIDNLSISPDVDIYISNPASNTSIVNGDYDCLGTTSQTGSPITWASWNDGSYNDFTFNATGRGNIAKTGISKFGARNANYDVANNAPAWTADKNSWMSAYSADETGTTKDPKLVITYIAGIDHTKDLSETMSVSESLKKEASISESESLNLVESKTTESAFKKSSIETLSLVEALLKQSSKKLSDTFAFSEPEPIKSVFDKKLSEAINLTDNICDRYSEDHYSACYVIESGGALKYGQSFTGNGRILDKAVFYLKKSGNPTGNAVATIYAHDGGTFGVDGEPTGSALATSENFDVSTLTTSNVLRTFNFTGANKITLVVGTHYFVIFEYSGGDSDNYICVAADSSATRSHPGNSAVGITTWTTPPLDAIFYVYTLFVNFRASLNLAETINLIESKTTKSTFLKSLLNFLSLSDDNICDSHNESNYNTYTIVCSGIGMIRKAGQSFTGNGEKLNKGKFYLRKSGSPIGNAVMTIYAHTGTFGVDGKPTGSPLATSENFDVSTLTTNYQLVTFNFIETNKITLANSVHYVVVLEYDESEYPNYLRIAQEYDSPTHNGNYSWYISEWDGFGSNDRCFYIYTLSVSFRAGLNLADTTSLAESKTIGSGFAKTYSDLFSLSEALLKQSSKNISDSLSLSSELKKRTIGRALADSFVLTEFLIKNIGLSKLESTVFSDSVSTLIVFKKSLLETLSLIEILSKKAGISFSDSLSFVENLIEIKSREQKESENLSLVESLSKETELSKAESLTLIDSFSRFFQSDKNLSEILTLVDILKNDVGLTKSDILSLSENLIEERKLTRTENITFSEIHTKQVGKNLSANLSLVEIHTSEKAFQRSFSDVLTLADAITTVSDSHLDFSESLILADVFTQIFEAKKSFAETLSIVESYLKDIQIEKTDSLAIAESLIKKYELRNIDNIILSEFLKEVSSLSLTESLNLSEVLIKSLKLKKTDSLVIFESLLKKTKLKKADSIALSEVLKKVSSLSLSENLSLTDLLTKSFGLKKTDSLDISESLSKEIKIQKTDDFNFTDAIVLASSKRFVDNFILDESFKTERSVGFSELFSIAETLKKDFNMPKNETLVLSEEISLNTERLLSDSFSLSDISTRSITINLIDDITLVETLIKDSEFNLSLEDALKLIEILKFHEKEVLGVKTYLMTKGQRTYLFTK